MLVLFSGVFGFGQTIGGYDPSMFVLLRAAKAFSPASCALHIDDASNGFMGDSVVLGDVAERLMFGSLLNLRPDDWRKPIPSGNAWRGAFR
jgi:hypothetical protein